MWERPDLAESLTPMPRLRRGAGSPLRQGGISRHARSEPAHDAVARERPGEAGWTSAVRPACVLLAAPGGLVQAAGTGGRRRARPRPRLHDVVALLRAGVATLVLGAVARAQRRADAYQGRDVPAPPGRSTLISLHRTCTAGRAARAPVRSLRKSVQACGHVQSRHGASVACAARAPVAQRAQDLALVGEIVQVHRDIGLQPLHRHQLVRPAVLGAQPADVHCRARPSPPSSSMRACAVGASRSAAREHAVSACSLPGMFNKLFKPTHHATVRSIPTYAHWPHAHPCQNAAVERTRF